MNIYKDKYDFYNEENKYRDPNSKKIVSFDELFNIYQNKGMVHIKKSSFYQRIRKGWSIPYVMSMDKHEHRLNFKEYEDSLESINIGRKTAPFARFYNRYHCKDRGLDKNIVLRRLYCGMDPQEAFTQSLERFTEERFDFLFDEVCVLYGLKEDELLEIILDSKINKRKPKYIEINNLRKLEKHIKRYIRDKEEKEFYEMLPYHIGINKVNIDDFSIDFNNQGSKSIIVV